MARQPKRQNLKPPRDCIFCGKGHASGNRISGEHIWPEWMHPYLPKVQDPKKATSYLKVRKVGVIEKRSPKPQQGHTYTYQIKAVCKPCNEVWMSAVENDAKPILIPLIGGEFSILSLDDQFKLAVWLAMKVMVIECEKRSDAVLSQEARDVFYLNRTLPPQMEIWISAHNISDYYGFFWHRTLRVSLNDPNPPAGTLKNIQTTTLCAGRLFTFTFISTVPEIKFTPRGRPREKLRRIWPPIGNAIVWPPNDLDVHEADSLTDIVTDLMRAPFSEWS